jgi:predicted methyltransferase
VGPSGRVYAVDVQDYFLRHIADKARKAGLDNIELVQGDARSSKLPPASVDVAFMSDVYHHLAYPKTYLADLHQAIRPGGRLVVVDFVREEGRSEAWILEHVRASPDQFRAEIEAAGFTLARDLDLLLQNFFHIYARK